MSQNQRISLTRIIALNWYGFREIFDVSETTLISGAFGTGKSAVLDLIQYVMLGDGWKPNRAASGRGRGRDLVGYCLCDTNVSRNGERHFLRRNGVTIIALEFRKPADRSDTPKRETWGVRIEYQNSQTSPRRTYFAFSDRIEYADLTDGESFHDEARFRDWIRREFGSDCLFSRQQDYLAEMATARHLYFDAKSFRLTFPKAIAFEPEEDVEKFVREFILEDSPLNVTEVRHSLNAYEDTRRRLEKQEEEAEFLSKIVTHQEAYEAAHRSAAILGQVDLMLRARQQEELLEQQENEIRRLEAKRREQEKQLRENEAEGKRVQGQLDQLLQVIDRDPQEQQLAQLSRQANELASKIGQLTEAQHTTQQFLNQRVDALGNWLRHGERLPLEGISNLLCCAQGPLTQLAGNSAIAQRLEAVSDLSGCYSDIWQTVGDALRPTENGLKASQKRLHRIETDLDRLKRGMTPGDFPFFEALCERFQDDGAGFRQLARLAEVKPEAEEWWPVIEQILADERWTVIPPSIEAYENARRILPQSPQGEVTEALLNPTELDKTAADPHPQSLFTKVDVSNTLARARVEVLLGNILCVEDQKSVDHVDRARAVSRDGYYKDAPLRRRLTVDDVRMTLGTTGLQKMKQRLTREKRDLETELERLERIRTDVHVWLDNGKRDGLDKPKQPERSSELADLPRLETRLSTDRETIELLSTPERTKRIQKKEELDERITKIIEGRGPLKRDLDNFDISTDKPREAKARAEERLAQINIDCVESRTALTAKFAGILDRDLDQVREDWLGRYHAWEERFDKVKETKYAERQKADGYRFDRQRQRQALADARDEHGVRRHPQYATDFDLEDDDNRAWEERLRRLQEVELTQNRELAENRKFEWQKRLQEKVLNELNRRIRDAEAVIHSLGRHLRQPIGHYRYRITQRRDRAGFGNVWQLLDSGFEGSDPLAQAASDAGIREAITELMDAVNAEEDAKDRATRLLDYRNYHHYDIEMVSHENPESAPISISRSGRNLSGGESQAPFFISMLAAFRRVYDRGDRRSRFSSQLGLVVMDEAFSKLSGDGIEDCLALARGFNLQLVMAFPPERLGVIAPFAQTVVICRREIEQGADGFPSRIENVPIVMTMEEALEALE